MMLASASDRVAALERAIDIETRLLDGATRLLKADRKLEGDATRSLFLSRRKLRLLQHELDVVSGVARGRYGFQTPSDVVATRAKEESAEKELISLRSQIEIESKMRDGASNILYVYSDAKDKRKRSEAEQAVKESRSKLAFLHMEQQRVCRQLNAMRAADQPLPACPDSAANSIVATKILELQTRIVIERGIMAAAGKLAKVFSLERGSTDTFRRNSVKRASSSRRMSEQKVELLEEALVIYKDLATLSLLPPSAYAPPAAGNISTVRGRSLSAGISTSWSLPPPPSECEEHSGVVYPDVINYADNSIVPITGRLKVRVIEAEGLKESNAGSEAVMVMLNVIGGELEASDVAVHAHTKMRRKLMWNEEFVFVLHKAKELEVMLNYEKSEMCGLACLRLDTLLGQRRPTIMNIDVEPKGLLQLEVGFENPNNSLLLQRRRIVKGKRNLASYLASFIPRMPSHGKDKGRSAVSLSAVEEDTSATLQRYSMSDFRLISVLGRGNYGKVYLVRPSISEGVENTSELEIAKHDVSMGVPHDSLYAMKVLKKRFILDEEELVSVTTEKSIFDRVTAVRHPFLVNLVACFQTSTHLAFVMEYAAGGDLMHHIHQDIFDEERARFYAAEITLALQFLHQNGIVYRDLKLDNVLLDRHGHVKLADFGLCKEGLLNGKKTSTFCGTPEFIAPEILSGQPYTVAVDWWAFGVLIYEMVVGQSPFPGDDEEQIFHGIIHRDINYPLYLSLEITSLIRRLLVRSMVQRMGSSKADAEEVKAHPFFSTINWPALLDRNVNPPFVPELDEAADVSNFDCDFTGEPPTFSPTILSPLTGKQQELFDGFSYTVPSVLAS